MQFSEGELYRLCQRIFFALGFPAGADHDAAMIVKWLASHGFQSVAKLNSNLPELRESPFKSCKWTTYEGASQFDVSKDVGYFGIVGAMDLVCAEAQKSKSTQMSSQIHGVAIPENLLPLCRKWSFSNYRIEMECAPYHLVFENDRIWSNTPIDQIRFEHSNYSVSLECRFDSSNTYNSSEHGTGLELQSLEDYYDSKRNTGLNVDDEIWRNLKAMAFEAFVPESEISRRRGAGAEVDDNE